MHPASDIVAIKEEAERIRARRNRRRRRDRAVEVTKFVLVVAGAFWVLTFVVSLAWTVGLGR